MNVITVASLASGTGKTTLIAHLASFAAHSRRCLIIDADPRGSFALYNSRRADGALPAATVAPNLVRQLEVAEFLGYDWVFIDTAPVISPLLHEVIRAATMVIIPARAGFLDLTAVRETADLVRNATKPHAVVLNAVPAKGAAGAELLLADTRSFLERYDIPVWVGEISERTDFAPTIGAADARSLAETEIIALWSMIERAVAALNAGPAAGGKARAA
jgi:chromosome partitioning protein